MKNEKNSRACKGSHPDPAKSQARRMCHRFSDKSTILVCWGEKWRNSLTLQWTSSRNSHTNTSKLKECVLWFVSHSRHWKSWASFFHPWKTKTIKMNNLFLCDRMAIFQNKMVVIKVVWCYPLKVIKMWCDRLDRWRSREECWLLFQRTGVCFPEPYLLSHNNLYLQL